MDGIGINIPNRNASFLPNSNNITNGNIQPQHIQQQLNQPLNSSQNVILPLPPQQLSNGQAPTELRQNLYSFLVRRTTLFVYFKEFFADKATYFNTLEFNCPLIVKHIEENEKLKKRTYSWAQLGYSIGDLLVLPNTVEFTRALCVLVGEFDHDKNESTSQKMKQLLKKNRKDSLSSLNQYTTNVVFTELPNIPFEIDFLQTFFSLCDVLVEAYKRILQVEDRYLTKGYLDLVLKMDSGIKKIMLSIIKEIDTSVRIILSNEYNILIRSLVEV